jgi:hypothetical protein
MADAVWLVIPQWFEGAARRVNADPVARKTFVGTDDRKGAGEAHDRPFRRIVTIIGPSA